MTFNNSKKNVYIALGSNMGNRLQCLKSAITSIENTIGRIVKKSSIYETEAQGYSSDNNYLNAVILCESELLPEEIMHHLLAIETLLGRKRNIIGYEDRPIDLDLLLIDSFQVKIQSPHLALPHPRILSRDFVTIPLLEVAKIEVSKELNSMLSKATLHDYQKKLTLTRYIL